MSGRDSDFYESLGTRNIKSKMSNSGLRIKFHSFSQYPGKHGSCLGIVMSRVLKTFQATTAFSQGMLTTSQSLRFQHFKRTATYTFIAFGKYQFKFTVTSEIHPEA